jgi:hypothetical protein
MVAGMTKRRTPLSVADAVMQAIGLLGISDAALAIGCNDREVWFWADPDSDRRPIPLPWAAKLDLACMAAGEAPPLWRAYRALLAAGARRQGCDPAAALGLVMMEVGDVARALAAAAAPEGAAGTAWTAAEAAAVLREVDEARQALDKIEAAVHARLPQIGGGS